MEDMGEGEVRALERRETSSAPDSGIGLAHETVAALRARRLLS